MVDAKSQKRVVVCIPTYNERENIKDIVPSVLLQVPEAEILVIDDNSPDGTGLLADELASKDARVHVLHRPEKQGLGRAYLAGFKWAIEKDYDLIIEFDADFSHDPGYLPEMIRRLASKDVVIGSRRIAGGGVKDWSLPRRLVSWGGSVYAKLVLGVPIHDLTGGFNGFRREALETIDYSSIQATGYAFQIEIKYRAVKGGLRVEEMPIVFPDRERGISKMNRRIFSEAIITVLRLRLGR